jgi:hypothetical protein
MLHNNNKCYILIKNIFTRVWGRDSSAGIATGYRLDGPGIEFWWGKIFRTCADQPLGTMVTGSFVGVKRLGCGAYHPPSSSAEVTNE